ncbi:MAG: HEAT repeat domain-containing protein [Rhodospirillaceae bacterium]|nr:HEAT repeat domain-containing protein [Rhodospirillaceae bacterium]
MAADPFFAAVWDTTWALAALSIAALIALFARRLVIDVLDRRRERRRKVLTDQIFKYLNNPSDSSLLMPLKTASDQRILLSIASRLLQNVSGDMRERLIGLLNDTIDFKRFLKQLKTGIAPDRAKIAARLYWADDPAVHAALREALHDPEPEVVLAAAGSLVEAGQTIDVKDFAAVCAARGMLANRAVRELFRKLAPANIGPLVDLLSHDTVEVVILAADALSRAHDPQVAHVLSALATTHPDADVRAQAVRSLGIGGHADAGLAVLDALQDERWQVRAQASVAAERLKLADAVPRLVELLRDGEWWVQMRAAEALAGLGGAGEAALEALRADPEVGTLAAVALAERHAA